MWLIKAASVMEKGLSPVVTIFGNIGSGAIALIMMVIVVDVGGRRLFNHPLFGSMDLSTFMMVIVVFFSMAQCELMRGHITIDLVVSRFRQRSQDIFNSIAYFIFLVTFGWMTWQLCQYGIERWQSNIVSFTLKIPVAPFIFVAAFGSALITLLVICHLLRYLGGALKE